MNELRADLPFRLDTHKILVVKDTPARICESCGEILLSDPVMKEIDEIIDSIRDVDAELEVVRYAA
jgi:YgiT-type zinc finger domain-containing protein